MSDLVQADVFAGLIGGLGHVAPKQAIGRVAALRAGRVTALGLQSRALLGDRVEIGAARIGGEVVAISPTQVEILPDAGMGEIRLGDVVALRGPVALAPDESWIGRVIDPDGRPLDGRPIFAGKAALSLHRAPPRPATRKRMGARLSTGTAAFDTMLPLVRGQRIGLFAGSGVGKSSLLGRFAKGVAADVVVIALIGERGRELREFLEETLGADGLARAVVVTATSDQSASRRLRCALSAMTVAEYFRDRGQHVLFLADSITRFAEAQREVALSGGEAATMRGYPPSLQHAIMSLAERAGPGAEGAGDITAVFSVLVAGSDMEEPVADILRGVLDGHVILDRAIAERGRFPAIDVLRSVSRSLPSAANDTENALITDARRVIATWERVEMMVQAGLYQSGTDAAVDRAIRIWPALDAFVGEASENCSASFARLAAILGG